MAFNSNFDSPLKIGDGEVAVSGSSAPPDDGMELILRAVAIEQGDGRARGSLSTGLKWQGTAQTEDQLVSGQEATAVGTETYRVTTEGDVLSAYITFTWTQTIKLQ